MNDNNQPHEVEMIQQTEIVICSECGEGEVIPQGRCLRCTSCGWSPVCSM